MRRAEERQLLFGQAWEDVFALAYRVNQTFGPALPDIQDISVDVTWQDANVRNELAEVQTAEGHKRLGGPDESLWRRLGYTPEDISHFKDVTLGNRTADIAAVTAALRVNQTRTQAQPAAQPDSVTVPANGDVTDVTEVTA